MSVMRTWQGRVSLEKADDYQKFMRERAVPDYSSVAGLKHLFFQRRDEETCAHFLLVTVWDSMEAVKGFAGDNPEIAKYYPEDDDFLLEKEKYVNLYQVFYQQQ